jgi:hypothetical protein
MKILSRLDMIKKIRDIKKIYHDHDILIQSDEIEFYDLVDSIYPECIKIDEIIKLPKNTIISPPFYIPQEKRLYQTQLFLAIINIISKSDVVITNSGNVGL